MHHTKTYLSRLIEPPLIVTMLNFMQIGEAVAGIWVFTFQDGGCLPSWIFKISKF